MTNDFSRVRQVFESVTILFSDVVNFTEICSRISPMEVVTMLNSMYSIFDRLTEFNQVYKVGTASKNMYLVKHICRGVIKTNFVRGRRSKNM